MVFDMFEIPDRIAVYNADDEFVASVGNANELLIVPMYRDSILFGYNLYIQRDNELKLVETYSTYTQAQNVKDDILDDLAIGIEEFKAVEDEDSLLELCSLCNESAENFVIVGNIRYNLCKYHFDEYVLQLVEDVKRF